MTKELTVLLDKLGTINYKYSLLKEKDRFNVFEILRKRHDEVHLHSRFIAELLNPDGTHGQGSVFLELFVEMLQNNINNDEDFKQNYDFNDLEKASVIVEHYTGKINKDKTEGGNIDIYIKNIGNSPIIIENKIYAEDQKNQLLRYHNYNKEGLIIYLTLYGSKPSDYSKGDLQDSDILLLSYREDIEAWLEKCIERSAKKPELRETIVQYQKLIHKLTGNTTSMKQKQNIYKLIAENDSNIINAKTIVNSWNEIKIQTEFDFWESMKKTILDNSEYELFDLKDKAANENNIRKVAQNKKDKYKWYGIAIVIGSYRYKSENVDIYFKIQRSTELGVIYGLLVENKFLKDELQYLLTTKGLCDKHSDKWPSIKTLEPELNFSSFSNETTLKMCNKEYREKQVYEYWKNMQSFIEKCEEAFDKMHYVPTPKNES